MYYAMGPEENLKTFFTVSLDTADYAQEHLRLHFEVSSLGITAMTCRELLLALGAGQAEPKHR